MHPYGQLNREKGTNMESNQYDVAVIGCGAMGSAACSFLARRGVKTIGIE